MGTLNDFKHRATSVEIKFLCNSAIDNFRKSSSEKILKDIIHLKLAEMKEHIVLEKKEKKTGNTGKRKHKVLLTNVFVFEKDWSGFPKQAWADTLNDDSLLFSSVSLTFIGSPFIETISSCLFLSWSCFCNSLICLECSSGETNIAPFRTSTFTWEHFYLSVIYKIKGVKLAVQTVYKHHLLWLLSGARKAADDFSITLVDKTSVRRMRLQKSIICSVAEKNWKKFFVNMEHTGNATLNKFITIVH